MGNGGDSREMAIGMGQPGGRNLDRTMVSSIKKWVMVGIAGKWL